MVAISNKSTTISAMPPTDNNNEAVKITGDTPLREVLPELGALADKDIDRRTFFREQLGDGITLTYAWESQPGTVGSRLPRHVVVSIGNDAPADVKARGVTTGLLRRVGDRLQDIGRDWHHVDRDGEDDSRLIVLGKLLSDLALMYPSGPRGSQVPYYRRFLSIVEWWQSTGAPSHAKDIAELLGVGSSTYFARLKAAERYLGDEVTDLEAKRARIEQARAWANEAAEWLYDEVQEQRRVEAEEVEAWNARPEQDAEREAMTLRPSKRPE